MKEAKAQFSIYKISIGRFYDIYGKENIETTCENDVARILNEIKKEINKKKEADYIDILTKDMKGIIYKTINVPEWHDMIRGLIQKTSLKFEIENANISYILFYLSDKTIYAVTAGYGSHLIKNFVEPNWGLHLMPKLLDERAGVIKGLKENDIYGNIIEHSKANRKKTNVSYEKKKKTILKELAIEIDDEVSTALGLKEEDSNSQRKVSILLKDSLNIRMDMNISKLKKVLNKIYDVEKLQDRYAMSFLKTSSKAGVSNGELNDRLCQTLQGGKYEGFEILGEDYLVYYFQSIRYIIRDEKKETVMEQELPISFMDLMETVQKRYKSISVSRISTILKKWEIVTIDGEGVERAPSPIINAIQGFLQYKKIDFILNQGNWFCIEDNYIELLKKDFKERYNSEKSKIQSLKTLFKLEKNEIPEDQYNKSFYNDKKIIVAHTCMIKRFEPADLIFWDDKYLYMMCNKNSFNAEGSRDLLNQIYASANYLHDQLISVNKESTLKEYYEKISRKYSKERNEIPISEKDFLQLFDKKLFFIAGYMNGYKLEGESLYAKYLTLDNAIRINDMGFEFLTMNIGTND